jgi:hypothetical protein
MKEGLLGGTLSVSSRRPILIQHGSPSLEMAEALTGFWTLDAWCASRLSLKD